MANYLLLYMQEWNNHDNWHQIWLSIWYKLPLYAEYTYELKDVSNKFPTCWREEGGSGVAL
jgi:hypothetical protein